jgi:hypothetical protein
MGLLQPHGGYRRGDGEVDLTPTLADVPKAVREVVTAGEAMGNAIVTIAQWSEMLVVHMRDPLTPVQSAALRARFPKLSYRCHDSTPHHPAHELLYDETRKSAVSFPLNGQFVR